MQKSLRLVLIAAFLVLASANLYQVTKEFRADTFNSDVLNGWTVTGFNDPLVTECGGESIVGGQGVASKASLSKTFNLDVELPEVSIQFDLYLIDSWNSGYETGKTADTFQVLVDGKKVYSLGSDASRQLHGAASNICGGAGKDRKTKVSITIPLTTNTFELTFNGNMASVATDTSAAWGIRELYILGNHGESTEVSVVSELNDDNNFDVSQWASNFGNGISTCGKKVFGGYGVAGPGAKFERKLENLPPHTFLTISLDAFFFDSLDLNDSIVFYVDGVIAHEQGKNWDLAAANVCGAGWQDYNQKLSIQVPHFDSSATVAIYLNSDQGSADESFGFRDFSVTASSPCPVIYSEPEGKGRVFSFCGSIPNLKEVGWTFPIKGIFIPKGLQLTVYENSQYSGKKYTISKTNLSLSGNEYVLVNKAFKIDVNEKKLRRQE